MPVKSLRSLEAGKKSSILPKNLKGSPQLNRLGNPTSHQGFHEKVEWVNLFFRLKMQEDANGEI